MAEGYRILVVEDDAAVRRLVTTTLDMHGYAVREAKTATQALLELSSQAPDLAILIWDYQMATAWTLSVR